MLTCSPEAVRRVSAAECLDGRPEPRDGALRAPGNPKLGQWLCGLSQRGNGEHGQWQPILNKRGNAKLGRGRDSIIPVAVNRRV
jgi:hypothetical protein